MKILCPHCSSHLDLPSEEFRFCPICGSALSWNTAEPEKISIADLPKISLPESEPEPEAGPLPESEPEPGGTAGNLGNSHPVCPICCTAIEDEDAVMKCPDCGMLYHTECWNDNNGCATYGCRSAGCLNPPPEHIDIPEDNSAETKAFPAADTELVCPVCGISLNPGETFCWSCGTVLKEQARIGSRYRLSGRYHPVLMTIGTLIGIAAIFLPSFLYACALHYNPLILVNALITYLFGIFIGVLSHLIFRLTDTRNKRCGIAISVILSFLALYFSWEFFLMFRLGQPPPNQFSLCRGIADFLLHDSLRINFFIFTEKGEIPVSGIFLCLLFLAKTVLISSMGIMTACNLNFHKGFCEKCRHWTKETFKSPALSPINNITKIQNELGSGKIDGILALRKVRRYDTHTNLIIQSCSCSDLNLLTIENVAVTEKNQEIQESKNTLLSEIVISPEAAEAIRTRFTSCS